MSEEPMTVPLIDQGDRGPLALLEASPERGAALRTVGERAYTSLGLLLGDAIGRAWLERCRNPYRHEIEAVAARLGGPGGIALNLSYEFACTGQAGPDPCGRGARLLRILDWQLPGLGANVVVARARGAAGPYYNVTWPGSVGVLTAMAPGRFSAAIHQAPMRRHGLTKPVDELVNRLAVWRSRGLPPSHVLRQVFEGCLDYGAARARLIETKLALPAIFLLAGTEPNQACLIERLEDRAAVQDGPGSWANDWRTAEFGPRWSPRGHDNPGRCTNLHSLQNHASDGFDWVTAPVLNPDTRLAVRMNAATAELAVLGFEGQRPATREFSLSAKGLAAA
jgi:hypothetical protein